MSRLISLLCYFHVPVINSSEAKLMEYRVKSGKFGHTFANSVNPDETFYEPSHQDLHCLLG